LCVDLSAVDEHLLTASAVASERQASTSAAGNNNLTETTESQCTTTAVKTEHAPSTSGAGDDKLTEEDDTAVTWTHDMTLLLLECRREHAPDFINAKKKKKAVWGRLSRTSIEGDITLCGQWQRENFEI